MASAAPSPLAGSTETTNGTKLTRLLVDGGGSALRKIFDDCHPPDKLAANLHSHRSTLDDLFARGILSKGQMELLFPPDGSNPNSKNFDISLLFPLLTEICKDRLSPPRAGWSNKPHAKNKSEAANIVRIKLFRNKLLHTPETRIDTPLFTQLWKEISGVLVSLRLGQAEINRLKAEPCREDYIDILLKWADREKDMKLKFDEVHQDQKKTHQTLEKVCETQRDQQVLLQDTKEAVQTVSQTQQEQQVLLQDTNEAVQTVSQTHQEQQVLLQDTKGAVQTVSQTQQEQQVLLQDTKEAVQTVSQTQQEQQVLLQDTKGAVQTVSQTQQEQQVLLQDTKEAVQTVSQTQQEQQVLLQDTKEAVQTVSQTQQEQQVLLQDTKEAVQTVSQTQQEQQVLLQDTKEAVQTVSQTQQEQQVLLQDTKEAVQTVSQTQQEQQVLLQDTKEAVQTVSQTQQDQQVLLQDTKEAVQTVSQTQQDQQVLLQDTKEAVQTVSQTQQDQQVLLQDTKEAVQTVSQTQQDQQVLLQDTKETIQVDLQEIKQSMSCLKEEQKREREEETLQNLAKCDFKANIQCYVGRFQEGTREWVFDEFENWFNDKKSQNRAMVICGNAGMGKSVISAVVCQRMQEAGRLSGCHFIQHNNVRYRKPQLMLQSLACQMCCVLPEFKLALVDQLRRNTGNDLNDMGVEELFALLFKEPLSNVADPGKNMLIVIDGLDESDYQDRNELLDVIANHFSKLPPWIRFLVTSRPGRNTTEALKDLRPFQLESNHEQNMIDIKYFIKKIVECIPEVENTENIVEKLAEKSEGLMLYAYFLLLYIEEVPSVLKQGDVEGNLPLGISSVYLSYFKRLENELLTELGIKEDNFLNLLSTVAASREPLPIDFVSQVLVAGTNSMAQRRKVLKAIRSVSSLLPVRGDRLHVFHKSVKDWLTDECCYGEHDFIVDEKEGHRILAKLCTDEMDITTQRGVSKGVNVTQFSDKAKYALEHGVRHMLELEGDAKIWSSEEVVKKYVVNLELVYAKLCVNSTMATEDIFCVQKHDGFNSLSRETKHVLETLLFLLRKNSWVLRELPYVFLQTVVNEGGTELSLEARKLLREKYVEIPFMECANKNKQQTGIEARFHCSSKVACCDISPQLDYMVCECADQTIQLWSLKTGIREWTNPVLVKKEYSHGAYYVRPIELSTVFQSSMHALFPKNASRPVSFYRSVVFHPNGKYVLPGNLSRVYTIDGKQTQLSTSDCKFSVCIFLANKTMMLTDCVDNSKCLVMWILDTGEEIYRITRNEDIVCFQCSPDETRLAISHSTGFICLLDLENDLTELGTISTSPCGLMNFSTENPVLVGVYLCRLEKSQFCWSIRHENLFQEVYKLRNEFSPWTFEIGVQNAFLVGDATDSCVSAKVSRVIPFWETGLLVQLNNERALMSSPDLSYVSMINLAELRDAKLESETFVKEITFSTNGEIMYVVSRVSMLDSQATVTVWDCSSGNFKQENFLCLTSLVPVKDGVVVLMGNVELWDVELSECKQCWEDLEGIEKVVSISEEQVAYLAEDSIVIVQSSSGDRLKTIERDNGWQIFAVNKKQQRIAFRSSVNQSRGHILGTFRILNASSYCEIRSAVWEIRFAMPAIQGGIFSPNGEFCVIFDSSFVEVYNAASGKLHCDLFRKSEIVDCKFITNKELIVCSREYHGNFLRMFDVRSGEHLNTLEIEERPVILGVCPYSLRIAVGLHGSDVNLIQVHLPRDEGQSQE